MSGGEFAAAGERYFLNPYDIVVLMDDGGAGFSQDEFTSQSKDWMNYVDV